MDFTARRLSYTSVTALASKDVAIGPGEKFKQARQILEWLKLRLIGEADPPRFEVRNLIEVVCLETEFSGDLRNAAAVGFRHFCLTAARGKFQVASVATRPAWSAGPDTGLDAAIDTY